MQLSDFGLCKPVDVSHLTAILEADGAQGNRRAPSPLGRPPALPPLWTALPQNTGS